ncbi:MAG: hypothetical protein AABY32_04640 [Nanoarchaeota archaeon]
MLPKYHIVLGFILSLVFFLIFPNIKLIEAGIIFLSSFLIDADHYIYYILNKKSINPINAINYFLIKRKKLGKMSIKKSNEFYSGFYFLHGIEILIILLIAGIFLSKYFLLIFMGFAFHLFLDLLEEIYKGIRLDKISVIYDWFKYKKLKFLE